MISLEIDERSVEVPAGRTILEAADSVNVRIPTMCHLSGSRPHASCMVCLVRDVNAGRMIPACAAVVAEGMVIDTQSEEVRVLRKGALELLLSEHIGDCEGPCRRACPSDLDIPCMIRRIASGEWKAAADLIAKSRPACVQGQTCASRCERVCRRNQIDEAVSIRRLVQFAAAIAESGATGEQASASDSGPDAPLRNVSVMGRLRDSEKREMMAGVDSGPRLKPTNATGGYTAEESRIEAARCMRCDCRKAGACRLRELGDAYGARQRRYRSGDRPDFVRVSQHADVVYEPGKCIKCGICVRIAERAREPLGLTFVGRGFDLRVGVPLGGSISEGLQTVARQCVQACPTGAMAAPV